MNDTQTQTKPDTAEHLSNPEWVLVTPELATNFLATNVTFNRRRDPKKVKEWSDKMRRGAWARTGATLDFDIEGHLINGQHRLQAIIDTGLPQMFVIVRDLPLEAFDNTDIGSVRSSAVVFARYYPNETNRNLKVAVARTMLMGIVSGGSTPDKDTVVTFARENIDLINLVLEPVLPMPSVFRRAPIVAAFANAVRTTDTFTGPKGGHTLDEVLPHIERYAKQMWTGPEDPMKMLFDKIQKYALSKTAGEMLSPKDLYGITVSALRAATKGKTLKRLYATTVDWGEVEGKVKHRKHASRFIDDGTTTDAT